MTAAAATARASNMNLAVGSGTAARLSGTSTAIRPEVV